MASVVGEHGKKLNEVKQGVRQTHCVEFNQQPEPGQESRRQTAYMGGFRTAQKGLSPQRENIRTWGVKGATKDPTAGAVSLYHYYSTQAHVRRTLTFQEAIQVSC